MPKKARLKDTGSRGQKCLCCAECCTYVAVEIDKPRTKHDFNNLIWLLMHENIHIYCDHSNSWFIEFRTRCKALTKKGLCSVHETKPHICKSYSPDSCTANSSQNPEKISIRTIADLERYYSSRKFRFKLEFPSFED